MQILIFMLFICLLMVGYVPNAVGASLSFPQERIDDTDDQVVDIAVGWFQSCALRKSGTVWCWGAEVLNGQEEETRTPTIVKGLSDIQKVSAGRIASCAVGSSGRARCWGANYEKEIVTAEPYNIDGLPPVSKIAIGFGHFCALTTRGDVFCWGCGPAGELGDGSTECHALPKRVQGLGKVVSLDVGVNNTCVVETSGTTKCWGTDRQNRDNSGFAINSRVPEIVNVPKNIISIHNARNYVCGLRSNGQLSCWGSPLAIPSSDGELHSLEGASGAGASVVGGTNKIIAVELGVFDGCALLESGHIECWTLGQRTPVFISGLEDTMKLSISDGRGCALIQDGSIRCWEKGNVSFHKEVIFPKE